MNRWDQGRTNEVEREIVVLEILNPGGKHLQDIHDKAKQREKLHMKSPDTIRKVLARLEKKGFVQRHDKKSGVYYLTPEGIRQLPQQRKRLPEAWRPQRHEVVKVNVEVEKGGRNYHGSGWTEEDSEIITDGEIHDDEVREGLEFAGKKAQDAFIEHLPPSVKKAECSFGVSKSSEP